MSEELFTSLVAEAAGRPDRAAVCQRYGVSLKTLERREKDCRDDPRLAAIVERKKKNFRARWENEAQSTMVELLGAIRKVAPDAGVKHLRTLAGAVKVVGELLVSRDIFPAREPDGEHDRSNPRDEAAPGSDAARASGTPPRPN